MFALLKYVDRNGGQASQQRLQIHAMLALRCASYRCVHRWRIRPASCNIGIITGTSSATGGE
jgi:hypothetical protein